MSAKMTSFAAAAALVLGTSAVALAQSSTDKMTPGHQMQQNRSSENPTTPSSPGASNWAPGHTGSTPGHQMQQNRSSENPTTPSSPGASSWAPGQQKGTTGFCEVSRRAGDGAREGSVICRAFVAYEMQDF